MLLCHIYELFRIGSILVCSHLQSAKSSLQHFLSLCICTGTGNFSKLCIVQHLKADLCSRSRSTVSIEHRHFHIGRFCIRFQLISHKSHTCSSDQLFLRSDREQPAGMYHHCPGGCIREPPLIQNFLRLTRSQKLPHAIAPDFHPRMIIITVRPKRNIHLPCRNPNTSEHGYCKGGLLPTSAIRGTVHALCTCSSVICRAIRRLLGTPVIDLQNRLRHRKPLNPLMQLFIEKRPTRCQIFIIYSMVEYVARKNLLRNRSCKWTCLP